VKFIWRRRRTAPWATQERIKGDEVSLGTVDNTGREEDTGCGRAALSEIELPEPFIQTGTVCGENLVLLATGGEAGDESRKSLRSTEERLVECFPKSHKLQAPRKSILGEFRRSDVKRTGGED